MSVLTRTMRRLTLSYVGVVAAIVVLFGAVTLIGFGATTRSERDNLLVEKATALSRGGGGATDGAEYGTVVFSADGRVRERDITAPTLGMPDSAGARAATTARRAVLRTIPGPDGDVRVASVRAPDGRVGQVGRLLSGDAASVRRLVTVLGVVGLFALVLAGVGGLLLSRRALRPVRDAFERQRTFVADASHELRTPLALVRLDAEVLARDPTAGDAPDLLAHQVEEIDRMDALLSELLLLARLDAGRLAVEAVAFDLAGVLHEHAARFRRRAESASVRLELEPPRSPVHARGDPDRTGQVLAALLDNAVRMTPPGGAVRASARRVDGHVEAEVSDTGPGIAPAQRERVFDRFHRAGPASAGRRGSGLGLAIARDLARAQGGDLLAGAAEGGGASMRLELPAGEGTP